MNTVLNLSPGPHIRDRWTTRYIMSVVSLALMPTAIVGVLVNGLHALLIILTSVVFAVGTEFLFDKVAHRPDTWKDCSAVVTGLLLALSLSPSVPLYIPALGSIFAILVAKCCFGGLGKNFINPALAGRCFLLLSFGRTMTDFPLDGVSTATPAAALMAGEAVNVTRMFLGTAGGVIGSSVLALMVGGLILWSMDIIHGQICFSVLGGFTLFVALFGGQGFDPRYLVAQICGGGVVMGAFFMATDYTTSPVGKLGQLIYGVIIGVLGGVFRIYGTAADSFSYSIITANLLTPLLETYIIAKPYAYRKAALARQRGEERKPFYQRIPRPVIALVIITLVAGVALSGVYSMTKDTIEEQHRAAAAAAYVAVVPGAESFTTNSDIDSAMEALEGGIYGSDFGRVTINEAMIGLDAGGNVVGYAISVTTADGNDGDITLTLGLNADGVINGIAFTELNETPGMGMRCGDPEFTDQFEGVSVSRFTLLKSGGSITDDTIDAISGATVTSAAVVNAVNAGLDFYESHMKGGSVG